MSSLIKGKVQKTLTDIMSVDLILACNMDGVHGKVPLKNFKRIFDALKGKIHMNISTYIHTNMTKVLF